ncbi:MAG: hypothetical protein V3S07_07590 [Micropepsaceae bacterium]
MPPNRAKNAKRSICRDNGFRIAGIFLSRIAMFFALDFTSLTELSKGETPPAKTGEVPELG